MSDTRRNRAIGRQAERLASRDKTHLDRTSACSTGKVCYPNRNTARRRGKFLRRKDASGKPGILRAYRCPFCDSWHLGHHKYRETFHGEKP